MTAQDAIRTAHAARRRLAQLGSESIARHSLRFFKTGPGEYGAGDRFRGIRVPALRALARACDTLPLGEALRLLRSPFHEDRLLALLVLVRAYERGNTDVQTRVVRAYLANLRYVNNWDLVDSSAPYILGAHLMHRRHERLYALARSGDVWERRVAILATAHFIRQGHCATTLRIARLLLDDEHDLIHKAVGWMLREVGHRCSRAVLRRFLDEHGSRMPRTMLRYAIEHMTPSERVHYFKRGQPRMSASAAGVAASTAR